MFFVECKPDFILITSLASVSQKEVEHAGNKSRILKKLVEDYENSVGVVDEDPFSLQPPYMTRFTETKYLENSKIKTLLYKRLNNRLLILCPRLEEWIEEAANEARVDLNKYNLPSNPNELHEIINIKLENFQELVNELAKKSTRVKELQVQLKTNLRLK